MKTLLATLSTLGASGAVHAALFMLPFGHPATSGGATELVVDIDTTTQATTVASPEPIPEPPNGAAGAHVQAWPTHTHPYPVAASHDWTPHDPNLVHPVALPAPAAPAAAASAVVVADDAAPAFSITVSTGDDPHGVAGEHDEAHVHALANSPAAILADSEVDGRARLVQSEAPSYPESARAAGVEGDVLLELVVGVSGAVESARLVRGVGAGLDASAQDAARRFRFAPATQHGVPVRVRMPWSVQFRLR